MILENMTVKELIEKMQEIPHDGSYTYVLSISPTGLGFRRHYKGSSQDDTRGIWGRNSLTKRYEQRNFTLEDINIQLKKAQIKAQITSLKSQLKVLNANY